MTLINTPFGAAATADEVIHGLDLGGKRVIVTGGSSGIGVETARSLARAGAAVTLAVRDTAAGERVASDIAATTGSASVTVARLDLIDLASVASFVKGWSGPLHVLVNNAGIMALPTLEQTSEGWEKQLATNHLGHFALTTGLRRHLAAAQGARVVSVSSSGHLKSPVVFEDLNYERRPYDPWVAYGQSKTANVLFAVELTRRWADDGITANALMPGGIMTNLQKHVPQATKDSWKRMEAAGEITMKTPQQGAATSVVAAVHPAFATGGHYLEDCNEAPTVSNDAQVSAGVRKWALDPVAARRLWDISHELVG